MTVLIILKVLKDEQALAPTSVSVTLAPDNNHWGNLTKDNLQAKSSKGLLINSKSRKYTSSMVVSLPNCLKNLGKA